MRICTAANKHTLACMPHQALGTAVLAIAHTRETACCIVSRCYVPCLPCRAVQCCALTCCASTSNVLQCVLCAVCCVSAWLTCARRSRLLMRTRALLKHTATSSPASALLNPGTQRTHHTCSKNALTCSSGRCPTNPPSKLASGCNETLSEPVCVEQKWHKHRRGDCAAACWNTACQPPAHIVLKQG